MTNSADFLIIGAGIAGASAGYFLAPHARCLVLERESQPGYHSTGRSAAQFIASYGPDQVRALTRASEPFFQSPPPGFTEAPLLTPRGLLTVAGDHERHHLDEAWATLEQTSPRGRRMGAEEALAIFGPETGKNRCRHLRKPDSFDMDVHAIHQGYLRGFRKAGGEVVCDAHISAIVSTQGFGICKHLRATSYTAPVLINAAGAWCDEIARLAGVAPIGLTPKRRTAFTFAPPPGIDSAHWPLVLAADESFYMKPDAGALLASPVNEDDTVPQDVQPEELDVALGVHALEQWTTLKPRPSHTWAGLRSFVAHGELVGGYDPQTPGFFWCAAQGGYGIQTSAAMGEACAALARRQPLPDHLTRCGVTAEGLSPARCKPIN
ncbi:MAG: FAD-dependent oxidoreductase [Burkholderiaceae bacterium]